MLAKKYRLTKEKDFALVFRRGKRFFGRYFSISYLASSNPEPRFAVIVANKVSKKATERNLLKRRTREIIRLHLKSLLLSGDFVVNVLAAAKGMTYLDLEHDFLALIAKIK